MRLARKSTTCLLLNRLYLHQLEHRAWPLTSQQPPYTSLLLHRRLKRFARPFPMRRASKSSREASYIFSHSCCSNFFALSRSTGSSCNIARKKEAHNGNSLSSILYIPRMASIFFAPLALRRSSPGGSMLQAFYRKSMNKLLTTFEEIFIVFRPSPHERGIKVAVD